MSNKITIWFPFILFFLGYFFSWVKSQKDRKRENKIYKDLIITWVKLAKSLSESQYIDSVSYQSAPLMYEKLNSLNIDKNINALVFNSSGVQSDRLSSFNKLIANINYLDKIEVELKTKYEKASESIFKVNQEFNETFTALETILFKKINEKDFKRGHKDYRHVETLNSFRQVWDDTSPKSQFGAPADHTFEKLIAPSVDYVKSAFNRDKSNEFLFAMYEKLNNMQLVKRKSSVYKTEYSQMFNQYASHIEESYNDLESCVIFFENLKLAHWWKIV